MLLVSGRRWSPEAGDFLDDSDESSQAGRCIGLLDHSPQVAPRGRQFAVSCGLPSDIADAIEQALLAHDWGKADLRFQAMLCGGDLAEALKQQRTLGQPLAKAPTSLTSEGWMRARQLSGYPERARHELVSVRLYESLSPRPIVSIVIWSRTSSPGTMADADRSCPPRRTPNQWRSSSR